MATTFPLCRTLLYLCLASVEPHDGAHISTPLRVDFVTCKRYYITAFQAVLPPHSRMREKHLSHPHPAPTFASLLVLGQLFMPLDSLMINYQQIP